MEKVLIFKWTVSKGRNTYGYTICSLWIDGTKVSSCNGGGYDMKGTALGNWIATTFETELLKLRGEYRGLSFHDPNYNPGEKIIENQTIAEREKEGKSLGLERYQSFYSDSSNIPTGRHVIPLLNGACGFNEMENILNSMGYALRYISETKNSTTYLLREAK